jgi:RNA polymerase sigma factor (sigma-70 family)
MADAGWKTLRSTLIERYDELTQRLCRALGSQASAENALHDTYLRLVRENLAELGEIRNPRNYLFRMALNVATSNRRREPQWLTYAESDAFLETLDDRPDPEQVAAGRSELALVQKFLGELPPRRRAIFEAAWIDELPQKEIAARHDLSVRMVQIELKQAMDHIAERLGRSEAADFVSAPGKASIGREGER